MNIMNNPMIKKIMAKAPENIRGELETILKDTKLTMGEKIKTLNDLISNSPNYKIAKKMETSFVSKFFNKNKKED
jgi:hypothetical protein